MNKYDKKNELTCSFCGKPQNQVKRPAGDALARAGAVGGADMTPEAAYAKAVFLLSQGLRGAELAAWMGRSIAGELDDRPAGA